MKISVIITCAGKGARANFNKNKLLIKLNGKTPIERVLDVFYFSGLIDEIIITASKEDLEEVSLLVNNRAKVVLGGNTRTDSVRAGLNAASGDIVLIHDGARAFVTTDIIKDCIDSVKKYGSGIAAIQSQDTIATTDGSIINNVLGKDGIVKIQTPQGFYLKDILKAYELSNGKTYPDDSSVYAEFIKKPHVCLGSEENIKLTYKKDFESDYLIGTGFDCHRLVEDRKLILGGLEIPHSKGLLGHSDADVLTHAIMDALLSAVNERDIGYHFPDTDDRYKGISSILLLKEVLNIVDKKGYAVKNVSAVIMAEKPKLLKTIPSITENLAKHLGVKTTAVGITATTLEGLGFVGREEGICVSANCLLIKKQ